MCSLSILFAYKAGLFNIGAAGQYLSLIHIFRIWLYWILSDYTILLKLLDGIIQRFGSHMNIPIHCCFDAGMTQQFLQHLRLHTAFDCSCSIGMSQGVHTKVLDPRFVAELI